MGVQLARYQIALQSAVGPLADAVKRLNSPDMVRLRAAVAQAVATYQRNERMIAPFIEEAVRRTEEFNQLMERVKVGVDVIAQHREQVESILKHTSEILSSVDWPAVRERLDELRRENEADVEAEIQTAVAEVYGEVVGDSSGEEGIEAITILKRMHQFQLDERRRCEEAQRQQAAGQSAMRRRDAIITFIISTASAVAGSWLYDQLKDEGANRDDPPSNVRQRPQRKAHRGKPNQGEPNRGKLDRAEPNRAKPDDGKPADGPVADKPKQCKE